MERYKIYKKNIKKQLSIRFDYMFWLFILFMCIGFAIPSSAYAANDKLYYSLRDSNGATAGSGDILGAMNADGTGQTTLVSSVAMAPSSVILDMGNNRAFLIDGASGNKVIYSINLTNNAVSQVANFSSATSIGGLSYDPVGDKLYYSLRDSNGGTAGSGDLLGFMNADGTGQTTLVSSVAMAPSSVILDMSHNRAFLIDGSAANKVIYSINLTNNAVSQVANFSSASSIGGLSYDPVGDKLYYSLRDGNAATAGSGDLLGVMNADGTGQTTLVSSVAMAPSSVILDMGNNRAFLIDGASGNKVIYSINLTNNAVSQIANFSSAASIGGLAYYDGDQPIVDLAGSNPANGASSILPTQNVQIKFNEKVISGSGSFSIYNADSGALIETIQATSPNITGWNSDTITIDPSATLPNGNISVRWSAGAVQDLNQNYLVANLVNTYYHFTVGASPATAPTSIVLSGGSTNAVGGVTNVSIPTAGGSDTTGAVTGWVSGSADKIKFTVTDGGSASSTITINGAAYTSGTDYIIGTATSLTIVVTTTEAGKTTEVRNFTVTVAPALSTNATVTSGSYTVGALVGNSGTITNVPFGTTKAAFQAALAKGENHQSWNVTGLSDPVVSGDILVVTAQDGTTVATYTVTANVATTYAATLSQTTDLTFTGETVGYSTISPQSITVNSTGTGSITNLLVALSGTNASSFTLGTLGATTVSSGNATSFTIKPNDNLAAGTYTATVTLSGDNGISESFNVSFTVSAALTHTATLSQTGTYTFTGETVGYSTISPQSITVNSTGTGSITNLLVALSGTNASSFTLGTLGATTVSTGNQTSFTIKPNDNLAAGTYTATVTLTGDNGISESFNVSFTVSAAPVVPAVNSVAVDPTTASIVQGKNKQLTKTVIAVGG
ncbi:beta strand repeat-containing protein, partial [Clostridium diolis]|uniref:beta strand repeat-containing protein n=1 Tax=Clostridium diolis TaxID=223919 RepID=UPI003AF49921